MIKFNRPYVSGKEIQYVEEAITSRWISGGGSFTNLCCAFLAKRYGFRKSILTTSCTDALEMIAILLKIKEGDEVIMPSFTFVSTANPFVLRGAKIIFCDSRNDHPNIEYKKIESLITDRTKAIVIVHYAGIAIDLDTIIEITQRRNIPLIEDAAQAIDSFYKGRPLGSFGAMSTISFHETKNISCGEGGLLVINEEKYFERAEILRDKGTNRSAFFRGEVDKYSWVDIGSSFLLSELNSAYLLAQLECLDTVQQKRKMLWDVYFEELSAQNLSGKLELPITPSGASYNGHIFFVICQNAKTRDELALHLKRNGIVALFHYQSLHMSPYYFNKFSGEALPNSERYSDCLLRLPLYYELTPADIRGVTDKILEFYL
ncbi:MAG: dTDP-4-amino-4,6-dideoxygalactose transaminase [Cyclobacteriaceae bacterium]